MRWQSAQWRGVFTVLLRSLVLPLPSARLLSSRVPVGRPTFRVASPSVELSEGCHSALLGAPRVSWGENDTGRPLLTRRCFVLLVVLPRSRIYSLRGEALMSRR